MRIVLASDHAGFHLKQRLVQALSNAGHNVVDLGPPGTESVDYPDFAAMLGRRVAAGDADRGVLVCGTGIGMAIAANKVPGVRAANCNDLFMAGLARCHNDANVLTLGARVVADAYALAIAEKFLETAYEGGRHQLRLDKIGALESSPSG